MRRRRERFVSSALMWAGLGLMFFYGCGEDNDGEPDGLCEPGANIFCRCPGGAPGTKRCDGSGESFGACEPCEARPSSGPGQQSSGPGASGPGASGPGSGGLGGAGGAGGAGGGTTGDKPLLDPCGDGSECQTGLCVSSFCTMPCTMVSQCPYPDSECVPFGSQTICMPTCQTAGDCAPFTAPPSACGYTKAIDNWDVTVCADWGGDHQLMPQFTDCLPFDHTACNLGYQQREVVCNEQGVCVQGCYVNADCPDGKTCNGGSGSLGQCV